MFSKKSQNITKNDISRLEGVIGYNLPTDFIDYYLSGNGGVSEKNYFYVEDNDGYVEISFFLPILPESNNLEDMSIGTTYKDLVNRSVIPKNYIPFAVDWGGNFFSLDINTNDIVILYMDLGEVTEDAIKYLTTGFSNFIDSLEEEGDEDEV